jgi:hypothetical protein
LLNKFVFLFSFFRPRHTDKERQRVSERLRERERCRQGERCTERDRQPTGDRERCRESERDREIGREVAGGGREPASPWPRGGWSSMDRRRRREFQSILPVGRRSMETGPWPVNPAEPWPKTPRNPVLHMRFSATFPKELVAFFQWIFCGNPYGERILYFRVNLIDC